MKITTNLSMDRIVGIREAVDTVKIHILFKDFRLVIYVELLIFSDEIPTFLSIGYMVVNHLDI